MKIVGLNIYPIKSCRGIAVTEAVVTPRGFVGDRRWMIVDATGCFITQREFPQLATLQVNVQEEGLELQVAGAAALYVPYPTADAPLIPVVVWESQLDVQYAGAAAGAWLSEFLGTAVQLVHLPDSITRRCTSGMAKRGDEVSFADGFAYLVTSMASLADLNKRMEVAVPMDRFRANIVVDGVLPWEEDTWHDVQMGTQHFELLKPCARCKITTTDQASGAVGREPLATLRKFRFNPAKKGLMFGINASPRSEGLLRVGDEVTISGLHAPPEFLVKSP